MTERCVMCGRADGVRSHCPRRRGWVVCRMCCIRGGKDAPSGHRCPFWTLCGATDLSQWEG
jgi:hypothetical protein